MTATTPVVHDDAIAVTASGTTGLHKQQPLLASIGSGLEQCKAASAALRSCVQAASSNPDKCCALLRAAGAALAALELAHAGVQDLKSTQLRQLLILSAALLAAIDLAISCVKVDGRQHTWLQLLKRSQKNTSAAQSQTIVSSFLLLTQQAAALSDHNLLMKQQVQRRLFFGDPNGTHEPAAMVVQQHLLPHQQQPVRDAAKVATVHCVLFIGSTSAEPHDEVWWSEGSVRSGSLKVHSLTTGATQVLDAAEGWGAVMCLHKDGHGNVWAGFRSGGVGLWSRAQRRLACQPLQCCKSPVRVIAADGCGHAYIGSQAGDLMAVRLRFTRTCGAATLELAHSLLLQGNGVGGGQLAAAHEGTVTAVAALDGRVWSSGGRGRGARLREWSMSGALHADVDLSTAGAAVALVAVPSDSRLASGPATPVTVLSGHADGAVFVWLAEGTHGLQRLRQLPAPGSAGAVRDVALCTASALLLVAHASGGVAVRSAEVAAPDADAAAGCPQHVVLLKVAKQGGIQQLASSSCSGYVISGSQGITQVPQAVLHQVAVDTGLVQVPQPSTPPQAPPASVRQVSFIEGNGAATAAPLTAQALGHLRSTAASSAGPASRYSDIQSATQATGLQDNASEVSAFTMGGSAPRIAPLPTGSDAAADSNSGDMYDPVAAASMAAMYAAEHVKALSGCAIMMPGVDSLLPQPAQPLGSLPARSHTRRFSASAAVKPSARRQSAEALLQHLRHNTSMVDLNSATDAMASTTARLVQRQQQQRQQRRQREALQQQAAATSSTSSAPSPSSSTSPPAPKASGFEDARKERLAARLQLEGGSSGSIRRYSPISSRRPSMTSVKESALEGCNAVDQTAVATGVATVDSSRLQRISPLRTPLGSSPLGTSSRHASAGNLAALSPAEQAPAAAGSVSPLGDSLPSVVSLSVPNILPLSGADALPSVRQRSSIARASMDRPNAIARPSQDAQGVFQAATFAAARASLAEDFRAAQAARLGGVGHDTDAGTAAAAAFGAGAGSMPVPQPEQLRAHKYPAASEYCMSVTQPSSQWRPDSAAAPPSDYPHGLSSTSYMNAAALQTDAPSAVARLQRISPAYSGQQQEHLQPVAEAPDAGAFDHGGVGGPQLQSETLSRWQKTKSGAEEAALLAAQLMWTRQQQQEQQQQQDQHRPHPLDGSQLPFSPQVQPYGQQRQQALPDTRQSVSRHSAPRFGLGSERRRTSVSRSSLPATSSTLRRRTPDPQLISSWANRDAFLQSAAGQYLIQFSDLSFKQQIGDGSVGRVHLGKWQETDVAIKMLSSLEAIGIRAPASNRTSHDKMMRTLEHEVDILASIRHPNIVLFMGVCTSPPALVTEFCARGSLYDVLRKAEAAPWAMGHHLDWPRRLGMALDAAKGLLQLHSHRPAILHRDLKSPNLLVDKHWRVKVGDFNLSRTAGSALTNSNLSANNPRWLAPEVITHQDYGFASDVYAFGIVLWELMTWRLPFESLNPWQIMVAVDRGERPEMPAAHQLLGGGFVGLPHYQRLMAACWAASPHERPPMEEVIAELRILIEVAQFERKALAMQRPPPLQQQHSGFTILVPPTEAGSEADPATSVTSASSADATSRPNLRRRRAPLTTEDFMAGGAAGPGGAMPASYASMMQPYRPDCPSDADHSGGSFSSVGTANVHQGAAPPGAVQRPPGGGMPQSPFSGHSNPGQQAYPAPASGAQPNGGRWTADAMMRTRWAARQLAGSGGSGSGDLAHRAVSGASMASLRAVYGTADPLNKVPSPTRARGGLHPFHSIGSSMSAGSSTYLEAQGNPFGDGRTNAGVCSGSGADTVAWHSMQQVVRSAAGQGSEAAAGGRSSVRSHSFSPARASVPPSIRRRSEGIPPLPPSKLSLSSGAARHAAAGLTEPPSPVRSARS